MSLEDDLRQIKSISYKLGMRDFQTWLKRLDERTEEDNSRVTSKWGWKPKFMHSTVPSATKEMSKIRSRAQKQCG